MRRVPLFRRDAHLDRVIETLRQFLSEIPATDERRSEGPEGRAREIARRAASKAAMLSGGLALPPGPLGYLTIIPDLIGIWRIQAQMVADIAGTFGKEASLSREHMLYCLFRHVAAQAVRDVAVRVGERMLIRQPTLRLVERTMGRISIRVTQRLAGNAIARLLPVIGAAGVAAYAYYDTRQVAETAIDLFRREIVMELAAPDDETVGG